MKAAQYKHNCPSCMFLGRYSIVNEDFGGEYDLYYCLQGNFPTLLARYGNEENECESETPSSTEEFYSDYPLCEAYRRAEQRGYDLNDEVARCKNKRALKGEK